MEIYVDSINFGLDWEICKTKEEGRIWLEGKEEKKGKTKSEEKKERRKKNLRKIEEI